MTDEELLDAAREVREHAHCPYSNFKVGAALVDENGNTHVGCNVENASYSLTICAERAAVFKAVSAGERDFEAIAVVTSNGGMPCGACRQVLAEFGLEIRVLIATPAAQAHERTVAELLPGSFGPQDLP